MRGRTAGVRGGLTLAAAGLMLLVTGCGAGEQSTPPSTAPPSGSATAGGGTASGGTAGPPTSSATPGAGPATDGPALASKTFRVAGTYSGDRVQIRFDLVGLQRRGDLLDLEARLVNLSTDQTKDQRWQVGSRFVGTSRNDLTSPDGAFAGAVLTDLAGKKRYFVAADSGRACVCTTNLSATFIGAGQTAELDATYAAPPTSTTTLDVFVPTLGTFRDVPIR